eukprot:353718-Chlamydomonas_euryale.AAC.1
MNGGHGLSAQRPPCHARRPRLKHMHLQTLAATKKEYDPLPAKAHECLPPTTPPPACCRLLWITS